jgi:hypothetical protein
MVHGTITKLPRMPKIRINDGTSQWQGQSQNPVSSVVQKVQVRKREMPESNLEQRVSYTMGDAFWRQGLTLIPKLRKEGSSGQATITNGPITVPTITQYSMTSNQLPVTSSNTLHKVKRCSIQSDKIYRVHVQAANLLQARVLKGHIPECRTKIPRKSEEGVRFMDTGT